MTYYRIVESLKDLPMNVSLTPELKKFVEKEVDSGLYQTASEVIRAGLRRLKGDQEAHLPRTPKTFADLEAQLMQSIERFDQGGGIKGKESLRRMRKWMKNARAHV